LRTKSPDICSRILLAAEVSFATKRFHEVRMEDIALAAQVGKGTIYRYFSDKEALYDALLKEASHELLGRLEDSIGKQHSAKNKLVALVSTSLEVFDKRPHLFDLILHTEALRTMSNEFPWQETRFQVIELVQKIFSHACACQEFAIKDPLHASLQLLGGLRAVIRFGKKPRPVELPQNMVSDFLDGFAKKC
jgi:AcrR family transcriptional regulator